MQLGQCHNVFSQDSFLRLISSQNLTLLFQKISFLDPHIHIMYSVLYEKKRNIISGSESQCSEGQCYIAIETVL